MTIPTFHGIPTEELDRWLDELTVPRDHKPTRPVKPPKPDPPCIACGKPVNPKGPMVGWVDGKPHHPDCTTLAKQLARCPKCGDLIGDERYRYVGREAWHRKCLGDMLNIEEWK